MGCLTDLSRPSDTLSDTARDCLESLSGNSNDRLRRRRPSLRVGLWDRSNASECKQAQYWIQARQSLRPIAGEG
ncbi:MAG: hypothetical protein ACYC27_18830 [Armatimonadota bacterium]